MQRCCSRMDESTAFLEHYLFILFESLFFYVVFIHKKNMMCSIVLLFKGAIVLL